MDKDTFDELVKGFISYGWMVALAMFGGLVKILDQLNRSKEPQPLTKMLLNFLTGISMSAFAGIITVLICQYWSFNPFLSGMLVGISGYLGGKSIDTMVLIWKSIMSGGKP